MRALLAPGTILPNVNLPATDKSKVCLATLPVRSVVAIYPWTGILGQGALVTPTRELRHHPRSHGSTLELEGFRDLSDEFAKRGIAIYGLSNQTTEYQNVGGYLFRS